MFTRPNRKTKSIAVQAAELAFAVPQVVGHRITRMGGTGGYDNPRGKARDGETRRNTQIPVDHS